MKILFNPYTKFNFNPSFNSFKKRDSYVQKYNEISKNDYKNYSNAVKNQNSSLVNFGKVCLLSEEMIKNIQNDFKKYSSNCTNINDIQKNLANKYNVSIQLIAGILRDEITSFAIKQQENNNKKKIVADFSEMFIDGKSPDNIKYLLSKKYNCSIEQINTILKRAISWLDDDTEKK